MHNLSHIQNKVSHKGFTKFEQFQSNTNFEALGKKKIKYKIK